ncbi:MAG: thioredoxin 1 [Myxococcota bacterium]|jgi:thioredoxin 1
MILVWLALGCAGETTAGPAGPAASPSAGAEAATGTRADADLDAFKVALDGGAPVVDVRTPQEFAAGHVPGAVNKPLGSFGADDPWISGLDHAAPLYVICQSGGRSARAADELSAAGLHAVNVLGGTGGWVQRGWPVEK